MSRRRFFGQKEVDIKLRLAPTERPRPLIPWWAVALRRVRVRWGIRRQSWGSLSGGQTWRRVALDPHVYSRRSVVKASFKRNDHTGGWAAHARYLSREGAQQEQGKGRGFDAEHDGLDMVALVRDWEKHDELLWRFIVSPEDASRLDLREHVRGLVEQMERDLDTKLQWVAIDHHNTDDAHVHLLVRGVRDDGRTLQIDREYLKLGMRGRSQEIATRELGPRLEPEVLHARERVIRKEQWTEIDRSLQRKANESGLVSYEQFQPRSDAARVRAEQDVARLQFLEGMGLAQRVGEASWKLSQDHERDLRERQISKDIIKSGRAAASQHRRRPCHLLVRGVRDDGRPLQIDREYLKLGMRGRSQEIVTQGARAATRTRGAACARARDQKRAMDRNRPIAATQGERVRSRKLRAVPTAQRCRPREGGAGAWRDCSSSKAWASPSVLVRQAGSSRKTTSAIFVNASISKDIIKSRARSQPRDIDHGLDRGFDKTRDRNG